MRGAMLERTACMARIGRPPDGSPCPLVNTLLAPQCVRASIARIRIHASMAFAVVVAAVIANGVTDAVFEPKALTPDALATINQSLPVLIDRTTRLDRVQMDGQRLTYVYTITDLTRARQLAADPMAFAEAMGGRLCAAHADLGAQLTRFDYYDTRRTLVASFTVTQHICETSESVVVADDLHI